MKRFTSLVLTFILLFTMFAMSSVPAFAAEAGAGVDDGTMAEAAAIAEKLAAIKAFVAKVEGKVIKVYNIVKAKALEAVAFAKTVPTLAKEFLGELKFTGVLLFKHVKVDVIDAVENVKAKVVGFFEGIKAKIVGFFEGIKAKVLGFVADVKAKVLGFVADVKAKVLGFVADVKAKVLNFVADLKAKALEAYGKVKAFSVADTVRKIKGAIDGVINQVLGFVAGNPVTKTVASVLLGALSIVLVPVLAVICLAVALVVGALALVAGGVVMLISAVLGMLLMFL